MWGNVSLHLDSSLLGLPQAYALPVLSRPSCVAVLWFVGFGLQSAACGMHCKGRNAEDACSRLVITLHWDDGVMAMATPSSRLAAL